MRRGRPIRVGLVGCGRIAFLRHLPALQSLACADLVAVADIDRGALGRVAARYGAPRLHASAEALIDDPAVECVGVLVPPEGHTDVAEAALAAGKHVLVEKPLALSIEECDRMIAVTADTGVIAMVGHNLRFHRLVRRARDLIEAGAIGVPEAIRTITVGARAGARGGDWAADSAAGGGVMMELGVHQYDLWRLLTGGVPGQVVALAAVEGSRDRRAGVSAILSGGAVAEAISVHGRPPSNEVTVIGSDGRLDLDLYAFDGLRLRAPDDASGSPRSRLGGAVQAARSLPRGVADLARGGAYVHSYANEWRHFAACVGGEAEPLSSLTEGREAVRVALAAARSATEGTAIEIADAERAAVAAGEAGHSQ